MSRRVSFRYFLLYVQSSAECQETRDLEFSVLKGIKFSIAQKTIRNSDIASKLQEIVNNCKYTKDKECRWRTRKRGRTWARSQNRHGISLPHSTGHTVCSSLLPSMQFLLHLHLVVGPQHYHFARVHASLWQNAFDPAYQEIYAATKVMKQDSTVLSISLKFIKFHSTDDYCLLREI